MTITLRQYQREAIDAVFAAWADGKRAPLVVLPTGAGKSLVIAQLIIELLAGWPDMRMANVAHVQELLEQNYGELVNLWPLAPAGIASAGLKRREFGAKILFGGLQTIAKRAAEVGHVDLLIIDEAHLVPPEAETLYGQLLIGLTRINPEMRIVGLTATPFRLGEGYLHEGEGAIFDCIAYEKSVREMIEEGYLCRPISKATKTHYDLTGVGKVGGDYNKGKLQAAVDLADVTSRAVDEVVAYGQGRRSWLLFCSGVDHARHVRDALRERGIETETVAGETPKDERARILADFKAHRIQAVTNNSVLTTGFNHPGVDLLAMMRPTLSTSLYVQMVGRGLRNAPGKENCLVLDFAGNVARHGPIDTVEPTPPSKGDGEAPIKVCPSCDSIVHAAARVCPDCGFEFPEPEKKIKASADTESPILSGESSTRWYSVGRRDFERHEGRDPSKPPTVKATYYPPTHTAVSEWLCPEHDGYAKRKADRYWQDHGGDTPPPGTVNEFLSRVDELMPTAQIAIKPSERNKRYFEVVMHRPGPAYLEEAPTPGSLGDALRASLNKPPIDDDEEIPF